ncbi:MAG TPA: hypothetical protein VGM91_06120 [Conexibacter sp.]|jgi:hypothetical protein
MTEVLDAIEHELVRAVRRHNSRVRRRRTAVVFAGAGVTLAVAAGAGYAAVEHVSISQLFGADAMMKVQPADHHRSVVHVDGGDGVGWSIASYRTRASMIATVVMRRPRDEARPTLAARNGFAIAEGLLSGPLGYVGSDVIDTGGRDHVLAAGTVAADVTQVTIEAGGQSATATLAPIAIEVPVRVGADSTLTPQGEQMLAQMPPEVRVRSFGAAFAPQTLAGKGLVRATVEARRSDGTVERQQIPLCVSDRCEAPDATSATRAAGQGRAG